MTLKPQTRKGHYIYEKRKQIVEPVFSQIKEVRRFRVLVRSRNPGPEGQVRVQLALPSEQPICYTQDLSCPNNLNQGVTNESIS
jgi:hypothetical protein